MSKKHLYFSASYAEDGQRVTDITGISEANLAGFGAIWTRLNTRNNATAYIGYWDQGAAAFVPANYNAFPIGSIVHDFIGLKLYYKTAAATWKYGAIAT